MKNTDKTTTNSNERGMTLIDMSVALIVIGLLAVPLIHSYNIWQREKVAGDTFTGFLESNRAITDFYFEKRRYPCPARLDIGPGDAAYGVENCTATTDFGNVRHGAVPFVTLKMSESSTLDGYKNKIGYTVTKTQTAAAATFPPGEIILEQFEQPGLNQCNRAQVVSPSTTAHFVLISFGSNGTGANTLNGTAVRACPNPDPSNPNWTQETINCTIDDRVFLETCAVSDVEGQTYYDDKVYPQITEPSRIWDYSALTDEDISSNPGSVGINNPNPQYHLDVVGNVKTDARSGSATQTGNVNAGAICDVNGQNCFNPTIISGTDPAMNCNNTATNTGMVGIASARARCSATYVSGVSGSCPTGQYMTGLTAGGQIICSN